MRNILLSTALFNVRFTAFNNPSAVGMPVASQSDVCETVTIKTPNGPVDINATDYNPKVHKLHEKETKTHNADGTAKVPDEGGNAMSAEDAALRKRIAETTLGVSQEGVKFFVCVTAPDGSVIRHVNMTEDGKPMKKNEQEFPGVENKGYDNSKDAWDQVFRLRTMASEVAATPAGQ